MQKIKITSIFVFLVSLILIVISIYISNQNNLETKFIDTINQQKTFTQEISKNIFYLYTKHDLNDTKLENSIEYFLLHHDNSMDKISFSATKKQKYVIAELWNNFYLSVEDFRATSRVTSAYSNIILEKNVNDIYNLNLTLIIEFDKLIKIHQIHFNNKLNGMRYIQYTLFFTLLSLLVYLFTQLKTIISFIQKFLHTSKSIIEQSTIRGLKPITVSNNNTEILEASKNFNLIVEKIDNSLQTATTSMENTFSSLEQVEDDIEDMLALFYQMNESDTIDTELTKKEDAVIESLEELISTRTHLQDLKKDLDSLITHSKLKK